MSGAVTTGTGLSPWTRRLARWETLLAVALIGLIILGNALSPFFLTAEQLRATSPPP